MRKGIAVLAIGTAPRFDQSHPTPKPGSPCLAWPTRLLCLASCIRIDEGFAVELNTVWIFFVGTHASLGHRLGPPHAVESRVVCRQLEAVRQRHEVEAKALTAERDVIGYMISP